MNRLEKCGVAGCGQAGSALLDNQNVCRSHFISTCYAQLDRYNELVAGNGLSPSEAEAVRRFVNDATRYADEMENSGQDLHNLDRAQLLHIILAASELGRHLRRSPRKIATIPVRIGSDRLGGAWEEDAQTVLLSRCGASVSCRHAAKPGETIQIVRADTGQRAEARIAWQRPVENDDIRLGIEFVNCENFWGLDWASVEETRQ
jgi:hypothetical protein